MPRLSLPPDMPEEVSRAIETIGNRARTELLRHLALAGPLTTNEIAERTGTARPSASANLLQLEAVGLVSADIEPQRRHGRTVRWSVNRSRVDELAATWARYATGR